MKRSPSRWTALPLIIVTLTVSALGSVAGLRAQLQDGGWQGFGQFIQGFFGDSEQGSGNNAVPQGETPGQTMLPFTTNGLTPIDPLSGYRGVFPMGPMPLQMQPSPLLQPPSSFIGGMPPLPPLGPSGATGGSGAMGGLRGATTGETGGTGDTGTSGEEGTEGGTSATAGGSMGSTDGTSGAGGTGSMGHSGGTGTSGTTGSTGGTGTTGATSGTGGTGSTGTTGTSGGTGNSGGTGGSGICSAPYFCAGNTNDLRQCAPRTATVTQNDCRGGPGLCACCNGAGSNACPGGSTGGSTGGTAGTSGTTGGTTGSTGTTGTTGTTSGGQCTEPRWSCAAFYGTSTLTHAILGNGRKVMHSARVQDPYHVSPNAEHLMYLFQWTPQNPQSRPFVMGRGDKTLSLLQNQAYFVSPNAQFMVSFSKTRAYVVDLVNMTMRTIGVTINNPQNTISKPSNDGRFAYVNAGQVYLANVRTGSTQIVAPCSDTNCGSIYGLSLSPDAQFVAFLRITGSKSELVVRHTANGTERIVTPFSAMNYDPSARFSGNGTVMSFVSMHPSAVTKIMDLRTGTVTDIKLPGNGNVAGGVHSISTDGNVFFLSGTANRQQASFLWNRSANTLQTFTFTAFERVIAANVDEGAIVIDTSAWVGGGSTGGYQIVERSLRDLNTGASTSILKPDSSPSCRPQENHCRVKPHSLGTPIGGITGGTSGATGGSTGGERPVCTGNTSNGSMTGDGSQAGFVASLFRRSPSGSVAFLGLKTFVYNLENRSLREEKLASPLYAVGNKGPAIAKGGGCIVYMINQSGGGVKVRNIGEGSEDQIAGQGTNPVISRDCRYVLYVKGNALVLYDRELRHERQVATGYSSYSTAFALSDNGFLAYRLSSGQDIILYDIASGQSITLGLNLGSGKMYGDIAISGDASVVAFNAFPDPALGNTGADQRPHLFVYDRATRKIERISQNTGGNAMSRPALSRDGKVVAWLQSAAPETGKYNVYHRQRGAAVTQITHNTVKNPSAVAISDDGSRVLFTAGAAFNDTPVYDPAYNLWVWDRIMGLRNIREGISCPES